jgi:hypothetical protein
MVLTLFSAILCSLLVNRFALGRRARFVGWKGVTGEVAAG